MKSKKMLVSVLLASATCLYVSVSAAQTEPGVTEDSGSEELPGGGGSGDASPVGADGGSPPGLDEIIEVLRTGDGASRSNAVRALGEIGDERAVEALIQVLQGDPEADVRGWAIRALHRIDTEGAREAAIEAGASDEDERVRALTLHLFPEARDAESGPWVDDVASPSRAGTLRLADSERGGHSGPSLSRRVDPEERARRSIRRSWGLYSAGVSVALTQFIMMMTIEPGLGAFSLIPFVGPVIGASMEFDDELIPFFIGALSSTTLQFAGFIAAMVSHGRARRMERMEARERSRFSVSVAPLAGGGRSGLAVAGRF